MRTVSHLALALLTAALLPLSALHAQPVVSQPVVQAMPGAGDPDATARVELQRQLTEALGNIAADGGNWYALSQAGRAALGLGDARAALGFLARAEALAPNDPTVKAALGATMVQLEDPRAAMRYFDAAVAAGGIERIYLGDRGLAFDLLGDQRRAQADYAVAARDAPSAELTRRYAISLGISGQADQAVQMLAPLLRAQDRAAWRSRAMIVAMNGRPDEARQIARTTMPPQLAGSLDPYFALMDRLTPDQLAAASHFGRFPNYDALRGQPSRAAAARVASAAPTRTAAAATRPDRAERSRRGATRNRRGASAPSPAAPGVVPTRNEPAARSVQTATAAPRDVPAAVVRQSSAVSAPAVAAVASAAPSAPPPRPILPAASASNLTSAGTAVGTVTATTTATVAGPPDTAVRFSAPVAAANLPPSNVGAVAPASIASALPVGANPTPVATTLTASAAAVPTAAPVPTPAMPQPDSTVLAGWSLASVVGSMEVPEAERAASAGALGLADIEAIATERRRIQAAEAQARATEAQARATARAEERTAARTRAATEAETRRREEARIAAEAAALLRANPARVWVQVATGANQAALAGDCRRLARQHAASFRGQSCATAEWGRTRRLIVGPFRTLAAARTWETAYKAAGGDGFTWSSDAGEVVTPVGGR